jgi:hypothetical protein
VGIEFEPHFRPTIIYHANEELKPLVDVFVVQKAEPETMGSYEYPGNPAGLSIAVEYDDDRSIEFVLSKAQLAAALSDLETIEAIEAEPPATAL